MSPTVRPPITTSTLRQFAGLWLVFWSVLAIRHGLGSDRFGVTAAFAVIALVVGVTGLISPKRIRRVFTGAVALTMPIGKVVSKALLFVVFYGLFAPVGFIFRMIGRDALMRRAPQDVDTYWQPIAVSTDVKRYFRQS